MADKAIVRSFCEDLFGVYGAREIHHDEPERAVATCPM
jgi:LysR family transcriptional regulator, transcriptional activator for bauABCD operon